VLEVLASYAASGFAAEFSVDDNALVLCHSCRNRLDPSDLDEVSLRRLEGASDPADMLAVVALSCPRCNADGILLLNYGPEATAEQGQVLLALNDHRGEGDLPQSQTPDEADASSH
jgi:hypothetical protein